MAERPEIIVELETVLCKSNEAKFLCTCLDFAAVFHQRLHIILYFSFIELKWAHSRGIEQDYWGYGLTGLERPCRNVTSRAVTDLLSQKITGSCKMLPRSKVR